MPALLPESLRVLVADDEAPARARIIDLLRGKPGIGVIEETSDGEAAVQAIKRDNPHLVFLDVQMSKLNGLQVIEAVGADEMPLTVFITAYDQHAIRAFDANALDYLLKPFSDERFDATLARARTRFQERIIKGFSHSSAPMLSCKLLARPCLDHLIVKSCGILRRVPAVDIDWIEGAGVYVNLHTADRQWLYRAALSELEGRLDSTRFIRIHRSAIVNVNSILELHPLSHGEFEVFLGNGGRPRASRIYRAELERRLGKAM